MVQSWQLTYLLFKVCHYLGELTRNETRCEASIQTFKGWSKHTSTNFCWNPSCQDIKGQLSHELFGPFIRFNWKTNPRAEYQPRVSVLTRFFLMCFFPFLYIFGLPNYGTSCSKEWFGCPLESNLPTVLGPYTLVSRLPHCSMGRVNFVHILWNKT